MTGFFIFNFIFSALVMVAIVGGLAWSIATSRVQSIVPLHADMPHGRAGAARRIRD